MDPVTITILLTSFGWLGSAIVSKIVTETWERTAKHFSKKEKTESLTPPERCPPLITTPPEKIQKARQETNSKEACGVRSVLERIIRTQLFSGFTELGRIRTHLVSGFSRRERGSDISDASSEITDYRSKLLKQIIDSKADERPHGPGWPWRQPKGAIVHPELKPPKVKSLKVETERLPSSAMDSKDATTRVSAGADTDWFLSRAHISIDRSSTRWLTRANTEGSSTQSHIFKHERTLKPITEAEWSSKLSQAVREESASESSKAETERLSTQSQIGVKHPGTLEPAAIREAEQSSKLSKMVRYERASESSRADPTQSQILKHPGTVKPTNTAAEQLPKVFETVRDERAYKSARSEIEGLTAQNFRDWMISESTRAEADGFSTRAPISKYTTTRESTGELISKYTTTRESTGAPISKYTTTRKSAGAETKRLSVPARTFQR